ncbi:MAG: ribbon-helix-helix domain-containing protein [Zestosphaera sp.]
MSGDKVISVKLPSDVIDMIDEIVAGETYSNRSDLIRDAIIWKLGKHGYHTPLKSTSL